MAIFGTLTPAERASQLRNPEGEVGIAVADWLNETNKAANANISSLSWASQWVITSWKSVSVMAARHLS